MVDNDYVCVDREINDRGFRERMLCRVNWIRPADEVVLVAPFSRYVYHPCDPQEGREVPYGKLVAVDKDIIEALPEGFTREGSPC